jgi:uncharacterized Zn finger protein
MEKAKEPCCGKCGSTDITTSLETLPVGGPGYYVYCKKCGTIITWIPRTNIGYIKD